VNDNFDSLGTRIGQERKNLGLNQVELAQAIGVSREMVGKYERDIAIPGADVLQRLASIHADVLYILTGHRSHGPVAEPKSRQEMALLDNFRHAPPDAQEGVLKLLAASAKPRIGRKAG